MATTNTIPDHYTIQFDTGWTQGIQQTIQRLRQYVTVNTGCTGKARTHNRVNSTTFNEQTLRLQATQGSELSTVKRWVFPRPCEKTTYLDEWDADLLGETVLPNGAAVMAHRSAAARKMDSIILDGVSGINYEGGDNDTGNLTQRTVADVASTYGRDGSGYIQAGGGTGNLDLQALIDATSVLGQNETAGQDGETGGGLVLAFNQLALDSLLGETELTSSDYNTLQALKSGKIDGGFMGISKFIRTEQLPANPAGDGVIALLWAKDHVHFDIWADLSSRISIRDDLSEAIQIRSKFMCGAARDEDQAVVWIDLDQTA